MNETSNIKNKELINKTVETADEKIKIIDSKGYNIEQFLCRCSNKTQPEIC